MKRLKVCVVDESMRVKIGWEQSLADHVQLLYYKDCQELVIELEKNPQLFTDLQCLIVGKHYSHLPQSDILDSADIGKVRQYTKAPLFLNWQGFILKEDLDKYFDGKIFHRYGVKWHTLRLRIHRLSHKKDISMRPMSSLTSSPHKKMKQLTRNQRCQELLKSMAQKASGSHRDKIEFYAYKNQDLGVQLLETLYNRLLIEKDRPLNCPSRYINSSPVIAARILQETLSYQ